MAHKVVPIHCGVSILGDVQYPLSMSAARFLAVIKIWRICFLKRTQTINNTYKIPNWNRKENN